MEPIKFRKAISTDLEFFRRCVNDLEQVEFNHSEFESGWSQIMLDPQQYYMLAEIDSIPVGYIALRIETQLHHAGKVAEILELYVMPDYRNKKIGARLIEEAVKIARLNNCKIIEVATNKLRTDALKFYEREGFIPTHFKSIKNLVNGL